MAVTISNAYIQSYERTVRQLAQQAVSKLRGHTIEKGVGAQKHNWDRLGPQDMTAKTTAVQATPVSQSVWSRRVSLASTFNTGDAVEQEDLVQMLIDPKSAIAEKQGMAARRAVDDIIIAAATGNALDGAGGSNALPGSQIIAQPTVPISFDAITAVQEKFMQNNIDPSIPKVMVVGPTQVRKLMQLTEQTSSDYVNVKALQELNASGICPNWMGFTWVMSTRLLIPSATQLNCIAFTKRAIGLQVNRDIWVKVAEDPSISFAWRIYCALTMGAVRVEDEQIVSLVVKDALV